LGSIFDLGDLRPFQPDFLLKGAAVAGVNSLAATNVHSIAIQVPISELTKGGAVPGTYTDADSTIGVWTTASRQKTKIYSTTPQTNTGPWEQVSRLGNPLINEVIIPMGHKDRWNSQAPKDDAQYSTYYDHPGLASLLNVLYPGAFPNLAAYAAVASNTRPDLDAVLLTGVPPLFPGFQNYNRRHQGRHVAPQRGDQTHGDGRGEHSRRGGWRQRRIPQRSPRLRRRREHRAQGRRGGAAR